MSESGTLAPRSALAVFRNRNFTLLWTAQLIAQLGTAMTSLAASLYIYRTTQSALAVGLIIMAASAPSLLIGLVAGVFADRLDRRRLMVTANLLRAGLTVAIPLLLPAGVIWLYALVLLSAAVDQFYRPAHASLLGDVTSEGELNAANAFMNVSYYGALALGTLLAGSLAALAQLEWAFYLNALTFLLAALLEARLRPALAAAAAAEPSHLRSVFTNLRAGFKLITGTQALRSLFFTFFVASLVYGLTWAIRLPFAVRALGATEFDYGLLESLYPIGMVAGSLALVRLGDRLAAGQWIALSLLGAGLTVLAVGVSRSVPPALIITLVEGIIYAPAVTAQALVIQRHTPRAARGRVFSAFFVLTDSLYLAGLAAGGLADVLDVRLLYLACGLAGLLLGGLALVLPGLGRPAAEWRRALQLLRTAPQAPGLGLGRILLSGDFARLTTLLPALTRLPPDHQQRLITAMSLHTVSAGTAVIRKGETGDRAYFILEGQAVAGLAEAEGYRTLEVLRRGDFFGEIAALTGQPRRADVITDQATTLVRLPGEALRELARVPELEHLFQTRMRDRLRLSSPHDPALLGQIDQEALRELRTPAADPAVA